MLPVDPISRKRTRRVCELFAVLLFSYACTEAAPQSGGVESGAAANDVCTHCHSSPSSPVPFVTPRGVTDPTARGAGAHNAHLGAGTIRAGLSGAYCHPGPSNPPGHLGLREGPP